MQGGKLDSLALVHIVQFGLAVKKKPLSLSLLLTCDLNSGQKEISTLGAACGPSRVLIRPNNEIVDLTHHHHLPFRQCQFSHPRRQEKTIPAGILVSPTDWLPAPCHAESACSVKWNGELEKASRHPQSIINVSSILKLIPSCFDSFDSKIESFLVVSRPISLWETLGDARTDFAVRYPVLYGIGSDGAFPATSISLAIELQSLILWKMLTATSDHLEKNQSININDQ